MASSSESDDNEGLVNEPFDYLMQVEPPTVLESPIVIEKESVGIPAMIGYTLCGDNIDKNVKRRYQRSDKTTVSLHYFHMYAIKNRVDFSQLSDEAKDSIGGIEDNSVQLMPSVSNDQTMRKNVAVLVSRVLVDHMDFFKLHFADEVCRHIKHKFHKEMSTKSSVVRKNTSPLQPIL